MVLALGGNNMEGASYIPSVMLPLINRLREYGVKDIIWIGPFRADESRAAETAKRHAATRGYLSSGLPAAGVEFVDVYDLTDLTDSRDGVHLTTSAYRRVVDQIKSQILSWASSTGGGLTLLGVPRVYVYAGAGVLTTLLFALLLRRRARRRR